jgi:hypothetical protein
MLVEVIPGREANPESRDSGFDASHRPGMTEEISILAWVVLIVCAGFHREEI